MTEEQKRITQEMWRDLYMDNAILEGLLSHLDGEEGAQLLRAWLEAKDQFMHMIREEDYDALLTVRNEGPYATFVNLRDKALYSSRP